MGEGAAVTIEDGVACLGGHDGTQAIAAAFVLRWDRAAGAIVSRPLPPLPAACANGAAVFTQGRIYVAGGESAAGPLGTLWRLDPGRTRPDAAARWAALPPPPGRPRFGGILVAVTTPAGERLLYGGGLPGPAKSQDDYLRDMWLFDLTQETWAPATSLPRGAVLAAALRVEPTRVLVLGGSDGHDFARMKELGDRYRIPSDVLHYDASTDRWSHAGTMPLGVVGAAVVQDGEEWVVAGGEYSPGLRTAGVYALRAR
jgi:N-acetylneuraminic acid mutarotase